MPEQREKIGGRFLGREVHATCALFEATRSMNFGQERLRFRPGFSACLGCRGLRHLGLLPSANAVHDRRADNLMKLGMVPDGYATLASGPRLRAPHPEADAITGCPSEFRTQLQSARRGNVLGVEHQGHPGAFYVILRRRGRVHCGAKMRGRERWGLLGVRGWVRRPIFVAA